MNEPANPCEDSDDYHGLTQLQWMTGMVTSCMTQVRGQTRTNKQFARDAVTQAIANLEACHEAEQEIK